MPLLLLINYIPRDSLHLKKRKKKKNYLLVYVTFYCVFLGHYLSDSKIFCSRRHKFKHVILDYVKIKRTKKAH